MKSRAEYDANLNRLIGIAIARIRYFEIDYQDGRPYFRDHSEIGHFLDYGVELIDPAGVPTCITWDGTFFQYGLAVYPESSSSDVLAGLSYDVSDDRMWRPYIGHKITAADSYWSWVAESMEPNAERTYYPQDIRLVFDNRRSLYLSAAQYLDGSGLFGMSDNVLIVFGDEAAKEHKIGPWAVA
jgi:hypothetical protein